MAAIVIMFSSGRCAEFLVAGIPAAARAAHAAIGRACAEGRPAPTSLTIIASGEWTPSLRCRAEIERLLPHCRVSFGPDGWRDGAIRLQGELSLRGEAVMHTAPTGDEATLLQEMRDAGRAIIAATGKPGDGIVSRLFNRPISRAITRVVVRIPGARPMHATMATAALGLAMALALFSGGEPGLIWGAVLFQAASIVDGVDGELARATFNTSDRGARFDSLTDGLTNIAFIAGLCDNLAARGNDRAAFIGMAGLGILILGLVMLGLRSVRDGGPFTFDALKTHVRKRRSHLMTVLTWLTMRDFYAALLALLVLLGQAAPALIGFTIAAGLWLAFVIAFMMGAIRGRAPLRAETAAIRPGQ